LLGCTSLPGGGRGGAGSGVDSAHGAANAAAVQLLDTAVPKLCRDSWIFFALLDVFRESWCSVYLDCIVFVVGSKQQLNDGTGRAGRLFHGATASVAR